MRQKLFIATSWIFIAAGLVLVIALVEFIPKWFVMGFDNPKTQASWEWVRPAFWVLVFGAILAGVLRERSPEMITEQSENDATDLLPLHEAVYNRAYAKSSDGESLTEQELVTLNAYALYIYIDGDGMDNGIGNMGADCARLALPALRTLGLDELAHELEVFINNQDSLLYIDEEERPQIDAYFEYCETVKLRLDAFGFESIPARLYEYLKRG